MIRNKKKKMFHIPGMKSGRCPYCGSHIVLRSADGIYKENSSRTMLYVCSRYPVCDAYVRVLPGTKKPVGSLANANLRALRHEAHHYFDQLFLNGIMSRDEAYVWLSEMLQTPMSQSHIGYMGEYYCQRVIEECQRLFDNRRKVQAGWSVTRDRNLSKATGDGSYVR